MYIHVIFNPNQEKNLLGNKVVGNSNNLNGVWALTQVYSSPIKKVGAYKNIFEKKSVFCLLCFKEFHKCGHAKMHGLVNPVDTEQDEKSLRGNKEYKKNASTFGENQVVEFFDREHLLKINEI